MTNYVIKQMHNPLSGIQVNLGVDQPLWRYVQKAIQDIEVLNILNLYKYDKQQYTGMVLQPFLCNAVYHKLYISGWLIPV